MEGMWQTDVFSFLKVSGDLRTELERSFPSVECKEAEEYPGFYCVSIPVDESLDIDLIEHFVVENEIEDHEYGVFMSVKTEWDSRFFAVPENLVELVRRIGGKLECAFKVI